MKLKIPHVWLFAGLCAGLSAVANAQVVQLRATLNGAQETPATSSTATGSAIMLYDVRSNTFDLIVSLQGMANTITGSHLHEAPVGTGGSVVAALGDESMYTRTGSALSATFHNVSYGGDKTKLLQGGAYYNVHSTQFPGGEIRGQLIAQPKRLYVNLDVPTAQAALAPGTVINSVAKGAAVMWYDPGTGKLSLRMSIYNFTNTLIASHFHEATAPANGPVEQGLGNASVYSNGGGGFYTGTFELTYPGDPVKMLSGGVYLNAHSNLYTAGEIKGWVTASDEVPGSRMINVSARGQVGLNDQVLIAGFSVMGPEPVRVLITAKGPSLAAYGLTGVLNDPVLSLYDSNGRWMAGNNDVGTPAAGSDLANAPGVPKNAVESALLVVLPPGTYSAIVSGNNGTTGMALLEVTDERIIGSGFTAE